MWRPARLRAGLCYDEGMFRTRDFVLLFTSIVFLVVAIGATLLMQRGSAAAPYVVPDFSSVASTSPDEYLAFTATAVELDRAQRVAEMRAKIAGQALISDSQEEILEEETTEETGAAEESPVSTGVLACAYSSLYLGFWDARDLSWIESEGARVLARGPASSTTLPVPVIQLPKRFTASGNPSCVGSDVIGIASDGSLIRNDEVGLYSVFGNQTLLGYALDGFPIYGVSTVPGDTCGGRVVAGQYRYELHPDAETVINCFAATPVPLP